MNKHKKIFITFGGPTINYHKSVERICKQAQTLDFFDNIYSFTEVDLQFDIDFWGKHKSFIESNHRGYGYWIWKSYLIKQQLDKLNDNDILIYADAGCHLNAGGKERLNEYIHLLQNNENDYGILAFQTIFQEYQYTKRKIFEFFDGVDVNDSIHNQATVILIRKNRHSIAVIHEWSDICLNHCELINDEICNESELFIENRHDQSIFSMVINKYGSIKLSDETWFYNNWQEGGAKFPFLAMRDR